MDTTVPEQVNQPILDARQLSIGYPQGRRSPRIVVGDIDVSLASGELVGLLGRTAPASPPCCAHSPVCSRRDLPRRVEITELLRGLARRTGCAALISTYDLDLAMQLADRLWLLPTGGPVRSGVPEDLVLRGAFAATFASDGVLFDPVTGPFHTTAQADGLGEVDLNGSGVELTWTARALQREGFRVSRGNRAATVRVSLVTSAHGVRWVVHTASGSREHTSIGELLQYLRTRRETEAERIFADTTAHDTELAKRAGEVTTKPTVYAGQPSGAIWYTPGGLHWQARLFRDAGANYLYADQPQRGNLQLTLEAVLAKAGDADYWFESIGKTWETLADAKAEEPRLTNFAAFQQGHIIGLRTFQVKGTGENDFWEQGVSRPDLLLEDIISVLHPELTPGHQLRFFRVLPES